MLDGIVGLINLSTCNISNCSNVANVTSSNHNAGGIVGSIEVSSNVTIEKVYNSCDNIKTINENSSGGIVGQVNSSLTNVRESFNTSSIYAGVGSSGGIIGSSYNNANVTIENCFNIGTISSGKNYNGGILGENYDNCNAIIRYCYNYGTISGTAAIRGGILGYQNGTYTGIANYWLSTCGANYGIGKINTDNNATKYSTEQMKTQSNFAGWDFDKIWKMDETKGYPVLKNLPDIPDIIE